MVRRPVVVALLIGDLARPPAPLNSAAAAIGAVNGIVLRTRYLHL